MAAPSEVPRLSRDDAPADYAIKLRGATLPSQRETARVFGLQAGTVSRYESEEITPPLGYLARLAERIVGHLAAAGAPPASVAAAQRSLLEDLRTLGARYPAAYRGQTVGTSWTHVARLAAAFALEHQAPAAAGPSPLDAPALPPAGPPWPASLPREPYYALPGREALLTALLTALADPAGPPILALTGLGGLGKTALALECAGRAVAQARVVAVLGESAKQEILAAGEIVTVREAILDFAHLVASLLGQLGRWELLPRPLAEQEQALGRLLAADPYLVLVDNLETAPNAQSLARRLRGVLGRSRAVLTSRPRVPDELAAGTSLGGLDPADTRLFLREEATRRQVTALADVADATLTAIQAATGGAPLALKLVVGQARFLAVDVIVRHLTRAGGALYPFLFRQSWAQLDPAAQALLRYIGGTVVSTVSWEELAAGSSLADEQALVTGLEQLVGASLVEVTAGPEDLRYSLHPLTRQFVQSTLPESWAGAP